MTTISIASSGTEFTYAGSGVTLTNAGVRGSSGAEHGADISGGNDTLINSGSFIAGGDGNAVVAFRTETGDSLTN